MRKEQSAAAEAIARRNSTVITVIIQKRFAPTTSSSTKKKSNSKKTARPGGKLRKGKLRDNEDDDATQRDKSGNCRDQGQDLDTVGPRGF